MHFSFTESHVAICSKYNIVVNRPFVLNGKTFDVCNNVQHLGHVISNEESKIMMIDKAIGELYMRTNYVISKFGNCTSEFPFSLIV